MKVGDYVRTKYGIIGKIKSKNLIGYNDWIIDILYRNDDEIIYDWTCGIEEYDILKSSTNIMDLIKKKDILVDYDDNIYQVQKIYKDYAFTDKKNKFGRIITLVDYQIKSIITHEQFERMQYKVESEVK